MNKAKLEQDLKQWQQERFAALLDITHPEMALLNYHRCDAVVSYIEVLLKELSEAISEAISEAT